MRKSWSAESVIEDVEEVGVMDDDNGEEIRERNGSRPEATVDFARARLTPVISKELPLIIRI